MKKVNVDGMFGLFSNEPVVFTQETVFGLNVGDKVKQIGKRKITGTNKHGTTSSNRVDTFTTPLEYTGTTMQVLNEGEGELKAMAFRIQEPDISGLKENEFLYLLYFVCGNELLVPHLDNLTLRIYKPHFEKV